jgi:hypothetical protein
MSFEDSLRNQLHRQADAVLLPERQPGRAVALARTRRHRRRAAAGVAGVAAMVAVTAGVVPALDGGDGDGDQADVAAAPVSEVLPSTGPLTFDWQASDDGLYNVTSSFQAGDGTVYALSTGPGFVPSEDFTWSRALYRLGDDGSWQHVDLQADGRPVAIDVAGGGSGLYAVSTGPGAGDDSVAQVSASTDGGDTWTVEDLPPAAPPSDLTWDQGRYLSIETAGDTTIALATTTFSLDLAASFPELAGYYVIAANDDGVIIGPENEPPSADAADAARIAEAGAAQDAAAGEDPVVTVTVPPAAGAPADGGDPPVTAPDADGAPVDRHGRQMPIPEGGRVLTWAELGVSGPADLVAHQVLRNTGGGWEPVETSGLTGDVIMLGAAGGRFIASRSTTDGGLLVSDDGASWAPVPLPATGGEGGQQSFFEVVSFGPALVAVENRMGAQPASATTHLHVSTDAGATWQPVDLAAAGIPEESTVDYMSLASGPLGVALVAQTPDGVPMLVVSGDLVDWTATPVADITGPDATSYVDVTVGADRVVITSTAEPVEAFTPVSSRTAVGTLVR